MEKRKWMIANLKRKTIKSIIKLSKRDYKNNNQTI